MNRRNFLSKLGLFSIFAPTAGARIWKARRPTLIEVPARDWSMHYSPTFEFIPSFQDFLQMRKELLEIPHVNLSKES